MVKGYMGYKINRSPAVIGFHLQFQREQLVQVTESNELHKDEVPDPEY
jgi:hypothetical protein